MRMTSPERLVGSDAVERVGLEAATAMPSPRQAGNNYLFKLSLATLGVVYGDIGTSPLYAIRECFHGEYAVAPTHANVLGVLSLTVWSLMAVISIKYLAVVMRADNRGEGGILALMALVRPGGAVSRGQGERAIVAAMGLIGAALLYGDGMITPAISVLSAVEGLHIATPLFEPYVIPITVVLLISLFLIQHHGTARVGGLFGPVTFVWFLAIATLGVRGIIKGPQVLAAANPWYAVSFFAHNGGHGFLVLGAVFLVVTGGEALYADMGHFGKRPIRLTWFLVVLPALLLSYFGQGALILVDPASVQNPFYRLAPSWMLYPLVALATAATIIASQAVISGCFSLTRQAIQLGFSPRMQIHHTSATEVGQIYVATVNWALMVATIALVLGFQSSSKLAAAYGVAVSTTMTLTTVLLYMVARELWRWNRWLALVLAATLLAVDVSFLAANLIKVEHGGWFPLLMAAALFTLMSTWKRGRQILAGRLRTGELQAEALLEDIGTNPPLRVPGTAVFMAGRALGVPTALLHNLKHNKVIHQQVILLTVLTVDEPRVPREQRIDVEPLGQGFYRIIARYGFMEDPDVPQTLALAKSRGVDFDLMMTTFFLGRETLLATAQPGMAIWREKLFAFMARNAQRATAFFRIPPNQVIEIGVQVEL
jgi:KUP system potassium uptake protein